MNVMQVKKYKLYSGCIFCLQISYQPQLSIRPPFTNRERILRRGGAPLFMYFPLLPKEKGFRVEVGYGKNWTILSQRFGFSPNAGGGFA